ncbi:MAG: DNA polymerase III subunit gamma/tau [Pseudomonadota bacterium]
MSYLVLARKWRPARFQDLLGQDHVAVTLRNAIKTDRVAHAFLFTGVRGVGKTSAARILSMALNCESGDEPTPDPCGKCDSCRQVMASSSMDVQEIDGASNNSVDDVRNLRETVAYSPASSRSKIYIIDEVHMLSASAFNALLKTLEEPPPHVKFIFATTEPHRIPVTILSRCQRFDFRKIALAQIENKLAEICAEEKITIEPQAVTMLAREAAGSMRDALSVLDQVIAAFGSEITTKAALGLLGIAGSEVNLSLSRAILAREVRPCLDIINKLDQEGYDLLRFAENYLVHVRDMIIVKAVGKDAPGLSLAQWEIEEILGMVKDVDLPELYRLLTTVARTMEMAPYTSYPRVLFETTFIKLTQQEPLTTIEKVLHRLGELKKSGMAMGGGSPVSNTPPAPASHGRGKQGAAAGRTSAEEKAQPHAEAEEEGSGKKEPATAGGGLPAERQSTGSDSAGREEPGQWMQVLGEITDGIGMPRLSQMLGRGILLRFDKMQVRVGFAEEGFDCNYVKSDKNIRIMEQAIEKVAGITPKIVIEANCTEAQERRKMEDEKYRERREKLEQEARSHPVVVEAKNVLGGKIVDIKTDVGKQ